MFCHFQRLLDVGLVRFWVENSRFAVISDMCSNSDDVWVHGGCLMTSEEIATKVAEKETKKVEREAELKVKKKVLV
ncbi:hypothetical protein DYB26_013439 [Aphanomyces astaci]|uniref:Uncharacterized protein n=1 Tax=Aphanomyces astaci TaxID=112090 RepID=A0A397B619_APHAT|nr:hypothetical protein DYB36_008277 [Aphanomyces astaci]RHY69644.1 hypothetical protein DYB34_008490 [Aphanomyces astaci]RHZ38640.1 hypothetical protein DYB26_013439 [Aphanomyces astaci]